MLALPSLHSVGRDKASPWCLHCSHTGHRSPSHAPSSGLCRRPFSPLGTSLTLNHSSAQILLEKAHRESPRDLDNEVRPSPVKHGCDYALFRAVGPFPHTVRSPRARAGSVLAHCLYLRSVAQCMSKVIPGIEGIRDSGKHLFGRRMPRRSYHYFLHLGLIT